MCVCVLFLTLAAGGCESRSSAPAPPSIQSIHLPPFRWIDEVTYDRILAKTKVGADPVILDVNGIITVDDKVTIDSLREYPVGKASQTKAGDDISFELLDDAGRIVFTTSALDVSFGVRAQEIGPDGAIRLVTYPIDKSPIGLRIPYPTEAALFRITRGDRVLFSADPLSRTLRDAILSIPDRGYDRNPEERRKALLAKVDAFEQILTKKQFRAALEKLENDIRDKVEKWVIEYEGQPDELSKAKVLAQVERAASRIRSRMAQ